MLHPNHSRSLLTAGLSFAALICSCIAQRVPEVPVRGLTQACCLQRLDGELWAGGPGFKAQFRRNGVEFTPALGRAAPHNLPLTWTLAKVGRSSLLQNVDDADPEQHGLQARYPRGVCVERYDVSSNGLAQSFVFEQLPPGEGDLIVRLSVQTQLPLVAAGPTGLRFEAAELGGVSFGEVAGIDANGRRCVGTITSDGRHIELRLPEAFLAHATLPLVLDPPIGSVFAVTNSSLDYARPNVVARGADSPYFFCVFQREFSAIDHDLRAVHLAPDGTTSSLILLTSTIGLDETEPAAATVTVNQYYVVVYRRGGSLYAKSVSWNGTVGSEVNIVSGSTDTLLAPRLGSELTSDDNDAVCVYYNQTQDRIEAVQIPVSSTGTVSSFTPVTLASGTLFSTVGSPRISHHGGKIGRYLVVYSSHINGGTTSPRGIVIDRNINVLDSVTLVSSSSDDDVGDVDGDGSNWVVAYESRATTSSLDRDIRAVPVHYDDNTGEVLAGAPVIVTALVNVDELAPAISFLGGSYMIAWQRRASIGSQNTNVYMKAIDAFTCAQCEGTVLLANTADAEQNLSLATDLHNAYDAPEGPGIVLWEQSDLSTGNSDIQGVAYESGDGLLSSPLPNCGVGGQLMISCARVGNTNFRVRLQGSLPASNVWLVMSPLPVPRSCGPCVLRADPFAGVMLTGPTTDVHGDADLLLSIPNTLGLSGLQLWAQWIVAVPSGQCSLLGTDFSTAVTFRIE